MRIPYSEVHYLDPIQADEQWLFQSAQKESPVEVLTTWIMNYLSGAAPRCQPHSQGVCRGTAVEQVLLQAGLHSIQA